MCSTFDKSMQGNTRSTDEDFAVAVAHKIERGITSFTPTIPFIQMIWDATKESMLEIDKAKKLLRWEKLAGDIRKASSHAPKNIIWSIRHYAGCMRYILRKRRAIARDDNKERAAEGAHIINLVVREVYLSTHGTAADLRRSLSVYTALSGR